MITLESTKSDIDAKLWDLCSMFWRLYYSDDNGFGVCYTCSKRIYYKEANLGHFLSRAYKAVKFHKDNLRFQCVQCNKWKNGLPAVFRENLCDEIGEKRVKWLEKHRDDTHPTKEWMLNEIDGYKRAIKLIPLKTLP